jgi:hypothetical protein
MNEIKMLALASFIAIFTAACAGGEDGSGSNSGSDVTPIKIIPSPTMTRDILFSELMIDPVNISNLSGEWFEVRNPGAGELNLRDCVFSNTAIIGFNINFDLIIDPGEYKTFAISANPGFVPDINYTGTGLTLNNRADTLTLTCNGITIDRRQYTMSNSGRSSALSNNGNAMWCDDRGNNYHLGNTGTPGAPNIVCL